MELLNFSQLGHAYLSYANPLSESKFDEAIKFCSRYKFSRVLDIGSGNGYLLKKFLKGACETGVAVDLTFSKQLVELDSSSRIEFVEQNANDFVYSQNADSFDLSLCIGATHALDGYRNTLIKLKKLTRTGGLLLIGEGYWKLPPPKDYLALLGAQESELNSHSENLIIAEEEGLKPLWARIASLDDWDNYEWAYSTGIEDYFFKNPEHPQKQEFLNKISSWRKGVWKWGRDTLGFGLYIFRKQ